VVVLERTGIGSGQSGIQPGGVRQQWGTAVACRLARESAAFWRESETELDFPVELGFRACGYLFAAHSEIALERLRANVAIRTRRGFLLARVAGGGGARARASDRDARRRCVV
jgi:sarcosine oxidase subunit beta